MKAKPTGYNNVLFRSRTEAMWAWAFDLAGTAWFYEEAPEWLIGGVIYLPDFWLPELGCYAEVKPRGARKPKTFRKAWLLTATLNVPCLWLPGPPQKALYRQSVQTSRGVRTTRVNPFSDDVWDRIKYKSFKPEPVTVGEILRRKAVLDKAYEWAGGKPTPWFLDNTVMNMEVEPA